MEHTAMAITIRPKTCPFCGNQTFLQQAEKKTGELEAYYIRCDVCQVLIWIYNPRHPLLQQP